MTPASTRCLVCKRPDVAAIDEALRGRRPLSGIVQQFGASKSALQRHKAHVAARSKRSPAPAAEPTTRVGPVVPPNASQAERVALLEQTVRRQLEILAGADGELSPWERAKMQASVVATETFIAKHNGSIEVSEARILRSPAWRRLEAELIRVLQTALETRGLDASRVAAVLKELGDALTRLGEEQGDR